MFDKEFAKEQIKMYLTNDLKNIWKKKNSGEYVPEYFELVKIELKERGENPEEIEKDLKEDIIKTVDGHDKLSGLISNSLKEKLNIANLELEDLVQLYVWESKSPYFMSLVESELIRRGEDIKKYVKPGPITEENTSDKESVYCNSCGNGLKAFDNFCSACGNPKLAE
ncbi:MAG: hypothetical protein A2452_09180 [Candidatus Firestonebacteria bacterium RIFOXYC2_FULL_39_67]|nr:MAG: hypothetical protein A2536_01695 [Candidatus Firestonebacteria bacterium RIFOXYD2_FULL_39_29]OGF56882.1 MAG: hypothetical protein A2452_09180 [Candidatus Firestonebacteria bacterium RIFOXYC2_FULL_39_67]OGF57765.1 MAG: hypothetical protein A2497_02905 [Candidatus Firestonebacteria bacterium RifOxyC12_full_39_7]